MKQVTFDPMKYHPQGTLDIIRNDCCSLSSGVISIDGWPGSGKSTFAFWLRSETGIAVMHPVKLATVETPPSRLSAAYAGCLLHFIKECSCMGTDRWAPRLQHVRGDRRVSHVPETLTLRPICAI